MMEELDEKVAALREELRDGRRFNQTGESAIGHGTGANEQARSGVQATGRNNATAKRDRSTTASNKRSSQEIAQRVRQSSGRPGNDGSSTSDGNIQGQGNSGSAVTAAIERLDDVPVRIDNELPLPPEKPSGRCKEDYAPTRRGGKSVYYLLADKSQTITQEEYKALPREGDASKPESSGGLADGLKKVSDTIFPGGKGTTLTNQEAKDLLAPLANALVDYGGYVDKFLQYRTHDPGMPDIWGDLTELEATVLARLMIRRGQKSPAAAAVVRQMVESDDYIQAAIIVVPRVMRTVEATRRIPRKPRIVR